MGIEAKNGLENYCFSLKSSIDSDQVKDKIDPGDKKTLEEKIEETTKWLDSNQSAQKEVEGIALPILQKMGGGSGGMPGGMPDMGGMGGMPGAGGAPPSADPAGGPTIEEID